MTVARRAVLLLAVLGILDAIYLTVVHFRSGALVCSTSGLVDCHAVLTSQYSVIFGVPTSLYGLIWFGAMALVVWQRPEWRGALRVLSWLGALVVIGLVYAELFLIGAICLYCSLAHLLVLAILVIVEWHQGRLVLER